MVRETGWMALMDLSRSGSKCSGSFDLWRKMHPRGVIKVEYYFQAFIYLDRDHTVARPQSAI